LLGKGLFFFVTVIGELLILQTDAFVVGAVLGAAAVPLFMIPNTLWLNFLQAQNIFLRPLWPVLSHAYVAGERSRVRALAGRTLLLSLCGGLAFAAGLVLLGDWFVRFWSKGMASLPPVMAWGFGAYALAASVDNVLATCLNAFGCIEVRFGYTLLFGVTKVAVAIATLHFLSVSWLPWAFAAAMVTTSIPFASMAFAGALRRMPEPEGV
jgi:O-antigen/teichoic acid export membrane protein